jgi:hypothetical protein
MNKCLVRVMFSLIYQTYIQIDDDEYGLSAYSIHAIFLNHYFCPSVFQSLSIACTTIPSATSITSSSPVTSPAAALSTPTIASSALSRLFLVFRSTSTLTSLLHILHPPTRFSHFTSLDGILASLYSPSSKCCRPGSACATLPATPSNSPHPSSSCQLAYHQPPKVKNIPKGLDLKASPYECTPCRIRHATSSASNPCKHLSGSEYRSTIRPMSRLMLMSMDICIILEYLASLMEGKNGRKKEIP